jgi:hypothetical protein
MVRRTIADEFRDEGRKEGRQEGELRKSREMLVTLLRQRFGTLPPGIEQTIQATSDLQQLDTWFKAVLPAKKLPDVGITP